MQFTARGLKNDKDDQGNPWEGEPDEENDTSHPLELSIVALIGNTKINFPLFAFNQ